jgi:protein phosphatase
VESVAIISDIHGNVTALEAVISDIRNRNIKRVFCLGDYVGKGPNPAGALDMCCAFCENGVIGNWDALMAFVDPGVPISDELQVRIDWHRSRLGPDRLETLARMPYSIDFKMSGRKVRLLHASPQSLFHRVYHDDTEQNHLDMFANTSHTDNNFIPDVVGYSDIHFAFQKQYGQKMLFNAGSVGNSLDVPTACYTILEGNYGRQEEESFSVEIIRVPYDVETEIKRAQRSGMPDIEPYAVELRTAKYRGHQGQR